MAQHDYNIANQSFPSFRSDLNNALSAIQTTNSGTSRPTGAVAGQIWLDTTNATSPTLKFYDGADDISLATINYTANTVDWLDSSITITGLSTTATGTVLTLSDTATTSSVNLIIDNQKEVRFRETTANGTNYVALKAPASLASDVTFTLPSADGTANQVLQTNGSGVLSFATVGGLAWQSVQTTGFTAVASRGYPCNTTSSAFTVTLPASATAGDTIQIVDYAGTFATNNLTINPNSLKIQSQTSNVIINKNNEALTCTYIDTTSGWLITSGANEGTSAIGIPYSVDFLVIAGGGSGGSNNGAGGGAGGYRTSTQTVNSGTAITITVGDGGTGVSGAASAGNNGSDSSISGSGLTTVTSTGGGGGGQGTISGKNGGSGGGGSPSSLGGTYGNGNTPSTSPSQGNNGGLGWDGAVSCTLLGGGGGAGAVGGNSTQSCGGVGGTGGNGTASSITGSSVTRAGGGGGAGNTGGGGSGTGANGGTGGGGKAGDYNSNNAVSATANTGGGGGGAGNGTGNTSGAGGKGVVILSMLTSKYSGTTTGSPTVTTSGSNTILTYNGSGSYTA